MSIVEGEGFCYLRWDDRDLRPNWKNDKLLSSLDYSLIHENSYIPPFPLSMFSLLIKLWSISSMTINFLSLLLEEFSTNLKILRPSSLFVDLSYFANFNFLFYELLGFCSLRSTDFNGFLWLCSVINGWKS